MRQKERSNRKPVLLITWHKCSWSVFPGICLVQSILSLHPCRGNTLVIDEGCKLFTVLIISSRNINSSKIKIQVNVLGHRLEPAVRENECPQSSLAQQLPLITVNAGLSRALSLNIYHSTRPMIQLWNRIIIGSRSLLAWRTLISILIVPWPCENFSEFPVSLP